MTAVLPVAAPRRNRTGGLLRALATSAVLIGVLGGAFVWFLAEQRPSTNVDRFARSPIGCTTTLEVSTPGTFYVYEESGRPVELEGCTANAEPGASFSVELVDDGESVALRDDRSIAYDDGEVEGRSVARIAIGAPGRYDLVVRGADADVVAAFGRAPDAGVAQLRRAAVAAAAAGLLIGAVLALLAVLLGRRVPPAQPPMVTAPARPVLPVMTPTWAPPPSAPGGGTATPSPWSPPRPGG